jgi:hypothetical protein
MGAGIIVGAAVSTVLALTQQSSPDPELNLGELVRSSPRIVVGRIERVVELQRSAASLKRDPRWLLPSERRWLDMTAIPFAELRIETTYKGRVDAESMWFVARIRAHGSDRVAAAGERGLFFFGERMPLPTLGLDDDARTRVITDDYWVGEASFDRSVPDAAEDAELRAIVAAQMPIIYATDLRPTKEGETWELFVYGDRRCILKTYSTSHHETREFDLKPDWLTWLKTKLESERLSELPDTIGNSVYTMHDSDFQMIEVTTLERTKTVRIWDARSRLGNSSDPDMVRAMSLMTALHNVGFDVSARQPN